MQFDKQRLLEFLGELDEEVEEDITLVAAGGTAMTLLGLKKSTMDIDFTIPEEHVKIFESALKRTPHGFKIDYWPGGTVFSQTLPDDYLKKSIPVKTKLRRIRLMALHPIDIVATKIGRLDERDLQDIRACVEKYGLKKEQIKERAENVEYVGHEQTYQSNLQHVMKRFYKR